MAGTDAVAVEEARVARARLEQAYGIDDRGMLKGCHKYGGWAAHEVFFEWLSRLGKASEVLLDDIDCRTDVIRITPAVKQVFPACSWADVATVFVGNDGRLHCTAWTDAEFATLIEETGMRLLPACTKSLPEMAVCAPY